jgi:acetylornithine deacetylase/succinyl-diaminopimelate desuccinylase-like protein
MRASALVTVMLILCGPCRAQKLHFSPVEKADILQRIKNVPGSDEERAGLLRNWFVRAGCDGENWSEQQVNIARVPNLICRMRGESDDVVIVGAHYDRVSSSERPIDNWTGAALLPAIFECLHNRKRHKTFIFVAFADDGTRLTGAEFFTSHLTAAELRHVKAMVNVDTLGLSPTKVWSAHSDKDLVQALVATVYAMKLPASQIDIAGAGPTDSQPFAARNIPQITIHSMTQANLATGKATAFRPGNYYDSYRLLCGYVAYLDTSQKARSRPQ